MIIFKIFLAHLIYLPRHLYQWMWKWAFWSLSQAATCYYMSNHSKVQVAFMPCSSTQQAN